MSLTSLQVALPQVISPNLACVVGQMLTKWSLIKLASGFKALHVVAAMGKSADTSKVVMIGGGSPASSSSSPAAAPAAAPKRRTKTPARGKPKTPSKSALSSVFCAACSWNNPVAGFDVDPLASSGKIPMDRKKCAKAGSIQVKDHLGQEIWVCAVHAKATAETCSRCAKNKHVTCDHGHGFAYLQTGYIASDGKYCEGTCVALHREGASKLAKMGLKRMAEID